MSQSLAQIWTHVIFSTKKRHPFLTDPAIRKKVHEYIKAMCHAERCHTMIVGGVEDHIHILVSLNKNLSVASFVERIKKSSSQWIKTLSTNDNLLSDFYWQSGYGSFSVSQSSVERVKLYIEQQEEHHKKECFQDELRKFLTQYKVAYDEKYLWD